MEGLGHLRAVEVVLTASAVLHKAHELELGAVELGEGLGVEAEGFTGQLRQAQARHPAGGALEGLLDQVGTDADRLEDLGAVIAGQQRDTDLGEDLAQAILQGLAHVGLHLIGGEGGQLAPLDVGLHLGLGQPVARRFPGEPGAHGAGAIADQAGHVMGAPALGRVHHQGGLQAQAEVEQVVVHRAHRQQGRQRGGGGADPSLRTGPVGEHQDLAAGAHRDLGLTAQAIEGGAEGGRTVRDRHQGGEGAQGKPLLCEGGQFRLVENRTVEVQHGGGRGLRTQGRPPLAQVHLQAHHQLLAQRIDRRVGDLGEALLEVVVEQVGLIREHRQGDVIAHAVGGLLAGAGHVLDHQIEVFRREAEGRLPLQQLQIAQLALPGPGLGGQLAAVLRQPGGVGMARGHLLLHLPVVQQATLLQIHRQHLARAETPLLHDAALLQLGHAGLRAHHHIAVAGDAVAGRAQAIAIQGGADAAAIGEHQQGRAVPGLLGAGRVLIERLNVRLVGQLGLVEEGLRHQGEQALGDRPAAAHQQLQGGVEVGRIAEGRIHHRLEVGSCVAPHRIQAGLRGPRPVQVAQQGVDLAVVAEQPHRLGQGPARQGVGAEAAVVHREGHGEARVAQVGVEARQHLRAHHALVNNGAAAEGSEIEVAGGSAPGRPGPVAAAAAQAEQQPLQGIASLLSAQQPLLDHRGGAQGHRAQHGRVHRHHPPAKAAQPQPLGLFGAEGSGLLAPGPIGGQEHHPQAPGLPGGGSRIRPHGIQERPGDAAEHAGAVAGIAIAAAAAAVLHAAQTAQRLLQHPVAGLPFQTRQKTHTAGVFLAGHSGRSRAVAVGPNRAGKLGHVQRSSGRGAGRVVLRTGATAGPGARATAEPPILVTGGPLAAPSVLEPTPHPHRPPPCPMQTPPQLWSP